MNITESIEVKSREEWRAWLQEHYQSKQEIWLIFNKKHSGKARIAYNDAVEEALCFGWIDSQTKRIDEVRYAQRFSRRKPGSSYSQANKERLKWLIARGMVVPEVLEEISGLVWDEAVMPEDIIEAIKQNPEAWTNFQTMSDSYKRIRIAYIESARQRPAEFKKRLAHFIAKTAQNRLIGYGGIHKYY